MKSIIVSVTPTGEVTVEADGFKGKGCEAATKAIQEALGKTKTDVKKKEYTYSGDVSIGGR